MVGRRGRLAALEVLSLFHLRRYADAADRMRDCLRHDELPLGLGDVAVVLDAAGSGIGEAADLFSRAGVRGLLLAAAEAPDPVADDLLEALWQRYPGDPGVLAVAARVGVRLTLARAAQWSERLRQHGLADHCPLAALARSAGR